MKRNSAIQQIAFLVNVSVAYKLIQIYVIIPRVTHTITSFALDRKIKEENY
jgi:hypothetical protein